MKLLPDPNARLYPKIAQTTVTTAYKVKMKGPSRRKEKAQTA